MLCGRGLQTFQHEGHIIYFPLFLGSKEHAHTHMHGLNGHELVIFARLDKKARHALWGLRAVVWRPLLFGITLYKSYSSLSVCEKQPFSCVGYSLLP